MKIGYLGVGTIAAYMIEGFCGLDERHEFFLSPRNAEKSARLTGKYKNIAVCDSNQTVVDKAEVIFISMSPASCLEALGDLRFNGGHMIVNLVATIPSKDIQAAVGQVKNYSHIVPLPFISSRMGPIAVWPESKWLHELLAPLGTVVFFKNMDEITVMQAITALMSTFYEMLHNLTAFAKNHGIDRKEAGSYTSSFFEALCRRAGHFEGDLHELALEMTPGGLNEFALKSLTESGAIKAWADILEPVMGRIRKK
ncbi:MAG: NAD(P)-binding domain-containing protein [Treponema sp.]|jgi:pyrroline-5-carboxylate reductase|nr:NAD(P)-binding domain-containing protein [Treponema sp.]